MEAAVWQHDTRTIHPFGLTGLDAGHMIIGMWAKVTFWVGAGLVLLGVVLGFVKSGQCGSVFQPRDTVTDYTNQMFGIEPPDCTSALDLTIPVWVLVGVGAAAVLVGFIGWLDSRQKAGVAEA